jgi:uncharacterized UPF0160 family protein
MYLRVETIYTPKRFIYDPMQLILADRQEEKIMIKVTQNAAAANAITHGGIFHADEVFATAILEMVIDDLTVCRVFKVPDNLSTNVILYDIGGGKFDHHQKGGNGSRENGIPFSSAGLIWKEYGPRILKDSVAPEYIFKAVDCRLISGIDAIDNGDLPKIEYPTSPLSISRIISMMNPRWDETKDSDTSFVEAVQLATHILNMVISDATSKAYAMCIVEEAISKAEGTVMVLQQFVPWQECVIKSTNPKASDILYVVYPSNRGGYNVQAVPDTIGGTGQRKPLPADWRGLNGPMLQEATGIQTATFCHNVGFICGADSFEDALALANMAAMAE